MRNPLHLHVYNRNDRGGPWWKTAQWTLGVTIRGRYHGSLLKGWWQLGNSSINRVLEFELALGGEDNMVQVGVVIPFTLRWTIGVRVPRWVTRGWIYQRREWTLRFGYIGRWAELLIASDEQGRDMAGYYRRQFEQGTYDGPWSRLALWPGIHLTLRPRLRDRVFGRMDCDTTKGDPEPVIVPMPEGNYAGTVSREDRVWKRKRWPWPSQKRTSYYIELRPGIPVPGKGENSWDIDDDAVMGISGSTVPEAIANATRAALRDRERYAGPGWTPDKGWPEGVAR